MPLVSKGFRKGKRADHFKRHQKEFPAIKTADEYEAKADAFLMGPRGTRLEGIRKSNGDRVRYDQKTGEFAILAYDGYIRTYFKKSLSNPAANLSYFHVACL